MLHAGHGGGDPEVRDPILDTGEAYEAIATILEDLPRLAGENRRDEFEEALADFETERLAVVDATDEINAQMSEGVPRCPKCGESGKDERCEHCRLILLYPDQGAASTYQASDLHRGWEDIFESSISVQNQLRQLGVATGELEDTPTIASDDLQFGLR
jgi:predicted RNA-binding Zn-ribbon protein involved in translation (DUF1610 family)